MYVRRHVRAAIIAMAMLPVPAVGFAAAATLPEGLAREPSLLVTAGRVLLALVAALLLAWGRRVPRFTTGVFFMVIGLGVGWAALAATSYALAIGVAIAALAVGLAVYTFAPRVALAIALSWVPPAVYFAQIFLAGGMRRSQAVALALIVLGAVAGALLPRVGVGVLAAALGTVLLAVVWPGTLGFWALVGVFAAAVLWQLALPRLVRPPLEDTAVRLARRRPATLLAATVRGALALLALLALAAVLAPTPRGGEARHAARQAALAGSTGGRPGFVLSPASSYYLFGRALPVALVGDGRGFLGRLGVLASGRHPARAIAELRARKDPGELATMRRAAAITASAFRAVAPLIRPGANERELEAAILDAFRRGGATGLAFRSVVGSGPNAVLPHYQKNDAELTTGLVVIDIGCSVDGYAADITRTFPVAGEWTSEQRLLLDTVLSVKEEARAALRPGASLRALGRQARQTIAKAGFGEFVIHGLGHHVGIEVHDAHVDRLEEGMTVTIEPGIYIPRGSRTDPAYWDLGVRVEDTYLVTAEGGVPLAELHEVLPCGDAAP